MDSKPKTNYLALRLRSLLYLMVAVGLVMGGWAIGLRQGRVEAARAAAEADALRAEAMQAWGQAANAQVAVQLFLAQQQAEAWDLGGESSRQVLEAALEAYDQAQSTEVHDQPQSTEEEPSR